MYFSHFLFTPEYIFINHISNGGIVIKRTAIFIKNAIILTLTSLIIRLISTFFNVYISNKIGTESIGIFSLVMSVYMFFITIATSSINLAATRIISSETAFGNNLEIKKAIRNCIIYGLILGIFSSFLLIIFSNIIVTHWLHNKITAKPLYFIALALPLISMSSAINGYFCAIRKISKNSITQIFENIIKIIATAFLLTIFLPKGIEYICLALIIADFISEVFSFLLIFVLYRLDIKKLEINLFKTKSHKKTSYYKDILHITIPVSLTSYIRSGLSTLKQLLIPLQLEKSGLSCATALSQYGIISGMAIPILMFPSVFINSFSNLLIPEITRFYTTKNFNKINTVITTIFKLVCIFSICTIGIFLNFSQELSILIYKNTEVSYYFRILAPLLLLMYLDNIIDSILKGLDKQVSVMFCNVLDLIVSIVFLLILLPNKGIFGYIIVIYISEILNFSISFIDLKRTTKFKINIKSWLIQPAIGILICSFIKHYFLISENYIFNIVCFVVIYVLGLMIGHFVDHQKTPIHIT